MSELHSVKLSSMQLRAAVTAIGHVLGQLSDASPMQPAGQDELVSAFLALTRALKADAGWRPQYLEISDWAIEALARLTAPPVVAKTPRAPKRAAAAAPKRKRRDARRRHDQPRRPVAEVETPLQELGALDDPEEEAAFQ